MLILGKYRQLHFKKGWSLSQLRMLIWDRALLELIGIIQIPMDDCLVGTCLASGLVICAGCLRCYCHALE